MTMPLPVAEPLPAPADAPSVLPPSTPPVASAPVVKDTEAEAVKDAIEDLGTRAFHTFWESAAATATVLFTASGLNVHQLLTIGGAEKLVSTVAVGAVAAGFSSVKTLVAQYLSAKK